MGARMSDIIRNAIAIAGAAAVTFGAYQLNHAAGWIVGGILAIGWASADLWRAG